MGGDYEKTRNVARQESGEEKRMQRKRRRGRLKRKGATHQPIVNRGNFNSYRLNHV